MNKILKGVMCAGLGCVLLVAGCTGGGNPDPDGDGTRKYDSETRTLKLATAALDGNFNPFFYTSQNDGNMIALTQIGMLTADENGNLVAGQDWATVALDYSQTMYDDKGNVTTVGDMNGTTEYQFVIKNGIKFSDGVELTIKDVLFNMYVYLDPAYTGSSTMYSTEIQGLSAYRAQDPLLADGAPADYESTFTAKAQARILDLINWSQNNGAETAQVLSDLETVKKLFKEEAESDWTSVYSAFPESYKDSYSFTEAWEAYLFNEGIVQVQTQKNANGSTSQRYNDINGNGQRDDGEPYYTTLDPNADGTAADASLIKEEVEKATTEEKVQAYMQANNCDADYALLQLQKEVCVNLVYTNYTEKSKIAEVLQYWATASNALTEFTGEARTAHFEQIREANQGKNLVSSISGITYSTVSGSVLENSFNGEMGESFPDNEYSVLKIVINGVDPKAIYNFSFAVAPLHYYSGTFNGVNYVEAFNGVDNFGVLEGNSDFFTDILQASEKQGLPVGAGSYKACTSNGGENPTRYDFFANNTVYFTRNSYFETTGTGIENAKIKRINYKVYSDDQLMTTLTKGEVDFGTPSATPTNLNMVTATASLSEQHYYTGGYGYVGINPKYVPEYPIRQAIMKAMNTAMTIHYYGRELAEQIYRPMSTTSWVYDYTNLGTIGAYDKIAYTTDNSEIQSLVASAGYTLNASGKYVKTKQVDGMANANNGTALKFTFTIAGDTTDHPAYAMFEAAATQLNEIGFEITVQHGSTALQDMTQGKLAVWAAAWSSASDPDMYQVYHMDSKATSVNNWNYPNILNDTSKWSYEYGIIEELSGYIDAARETLDRQTRSDIYVICLDLVMDLAVELPTYQRMDLCVYNNTVIDGSTLVQKASYNMGLFDKIWEINYV